MLTLLDGDCVVYLASFLDAHEACRLAASRELAELLGPQRERWRLVKAGIKELGDELGGLVRQQRRWSLVDPNPYVEHHIGLLLDKLCASIHALRWSACGARWHLDVVAETFEYIWGSPLTWVGLCRSPRRDEVARRLSARLRIAEDAARPLYTESDVLLYSRKHASRRPNYVCLRLSYTHVACSPKFKLRFAKDLETQDWIDLDTGARRPQPPDCIAAALAAACAC